MSKLNSPQAKALAKKALDLTEAGALNELKLEQLREFFSDLGQSEDPLAKPLEQLTRLLKPEMSEREIYCLAVPLERYLQRSPSDDQFLVTSTDRITTAVARRPVHFILDNLRSAFNVGSIFRLGDCVGASSIAICGYTANPKDNTDLKKTSLGASDFVNYEIFPRVLDAIRAAKSAGHTIIALETAQNATPLTEASLQGPVSVVVGNERFGLEADVLAECDQIIKIPTYGYKNSLNVSNALSIFSYEWSRQNP